jgi:serine/threonine protein kinase
MGEVWEAEDRRPHRRVAAKIVPADPSTDDELAERLRKEALSQAQLQHPGITVVNDMDEHEGDPYFVMELLDGRNLGEVLAGQPGGLAPTSAVTLMIGVADALDCAHRKGIVHRDIKPANLMLLNDGTGRSVKICDFGIARFVDATRTAMDGRRRESRTPSGGGTRAYTTAPASCCT